MDWIITLPKSISWTDYQRELDAVKDFTAVMNYRLPFRAGVKRGDRCFLVWRGYVRGWMRVTADLNSCQQGFVCGITHKEWPAGFYIHRSGPFHYTEPLKMSGFRGIKKAQKDVSELKEIPPEMCGENGPWIKATIELDLSRWLSPNSRLILKENQGE